MQKQRISNLCFPCLTLVLFALCTYQFHIVEIIDPHGALDFRKSLCRCLTGFLAALFQDFINGGNILLQLDRKSVV